MGLTSEREVSRERERNRETENDVRERPGAVVLHGGGDHEEEGRVFPWAEKETNGRENEEIRELINEEHLSNMVRRVPQGM
jgi:hypothetical protein